MAMIDIPLADDLEALLEARLKVGDYANIGDYVRDLIQSDLAGAWEIDSDVAAAIDEGEASGYSDKSLEQIFAEARAQYLSG